MYLDQKVTVICTDRDTKNEGKIIRMYGNGIDVEVLGVIVKLNCARYTLDFVFINNPLTVFLQSFIHKE